MGLVIVIVVLVEQREVHQGVDVHGGAGADALVQLDRLGVFSPAIVEHRQAETRGFVVGVLVERALVELDGLLVQALVFRILAAAEILLGGAVINRRNSHFAHGLSL